MLPRAPPRPTPGTSAESWPLLSRLALAIPRPPHSPPERLVTVALTCPARTARAPLTSASARPNLSRALYHAFGETPDLPRLETQAGIINPALPKVVRQRVTFFCYLTISVPCCPACA